MLETIIKMKRFSWETYIFDIRSKFSVKFCVECIYQVRFGLIFLIVYFLLIIVYFLLIFPS